MAAFTAFLSVVAVCIQYQTIRAKEEEGLGRVISDAETQSQLIAAEINQWILTEGSEVQSRAVSGIDSVHSREKRASQIHPPNNKISKRRAKVLKSKHIVANSPKQSMKHLHASKRTSKKSPFHPKVVKFPGRLHIKKRGRADSHAHAPRGNKTHLTLEKAKKKTNVSSNKRVEKISKAATHLKNSKAKVQRHYKKSTIPGTAKQKQQNRLRQKSDVAKIDPKIIKVFQKFPRKTLTGYLHKKGVSEKYIKAIIKQVKKPNGTIHKNKTKANMEVKRQNISKPLGSVVTTKQELDGRKGKLSVKKSQIPNNRDSRAQKVKDHASGTTKQRKKLKTTLSKHEKHTKKEKYSSSQPATQKVVGPLKKSTKRRNSSAHARILTNAPEQKLVRLKHKIRKANNLKLRVAKALLSHCETQNRLKKVFENVNKSLRKAAKLARAIGEKFGVKKEDIDNMTSEHTRDAVEEFLGKLF